MRKRHGEIGLHLLNEKRQHLKNQSFWLFVGSFNASYRRAIMLNQL